MRFVTFMKDADVHVGLIEGADLIDIQALIPDAPADLSGVIKAGTPLLTAMHSALSAVPATMRAPLNSVQLLPPLPNPGKILCLGLNYIDHAKEGGNEVPDYPAVFLRTPTTLVAPGGPVLRPRISERVDYEVELMVVIGATCVDVLESEALEKVFGYTVFNDVSIRDYQRKTTQWTVGKNFDGSGPMGPAIVTADELPPGAHGLGIRSRLNGQIMQDGNTADMVFSIARTISILSQVMTLDPGDVIAMGTPSGVGHARKPPVWMKAGDVIECEIDGIGILSNPIVEASELRGRG